MHTYTLNKIIKTIQEAGFHTLSFFLTRRFVITPTLIVLLLFANDFVTMSIAADHATPNPTPDRWQVGHLVSSALALATILLVESFLVLWRMLGVFHQSLAQTQTRVLLMLVFSGQALVSVVRERGRFWSSLPGRSLLVASLCDLLVVSGLAALGILRKNYAGSSPPISRTLSRRGETASATTMTLYPTCIFPLVCAPE